MKTDFKNINEKNINPNSVFFLYGNNRRPFTVFCDFVIDILKKKFADVDIFYVSVSDCLKIIENQCDLFGTKINCFCIKGIEDSHLAKLDSWLGTDNNIFILDSGDFMKSKKVSDALQKDPRVQALPSFKNDMTLLSICKMVMPTVPQNICNEIVKIINETDEGLSSLFKKMSLLTDDNNFALLHEYYTYKTSFLNEFELIPLIRFLQQAVIKEKVQGRSQSYLGFNLSGKNLMRDLLNSELKQKEGMEISKSYIYNEIN